MNNIVNIKIKTRYKDADMQGVIHNSVYLVYYDEARLEFIDKYITEYNEENERLMVHAISNEYIKPLYARDIIEVKIGLVKQTSVRSQFKIEIYSENGELVHTAIQDMVWTDKNSNLINIQKDMPKLYNTLKNLEIKNMEN